MIRFFNILLCLFIVAGITSCGSSEIIPTTDICSIVKHPKDLIYQVKINDQKINSRWYLKQDALEITKALAKQNKCMP